MNVIELLNFIEENQSCSKPFEDLHIINNQVVGFYKTIYVGYKDSNDKPKSYLFPTTFELVNNRIRTTMIFGSVERNFEIKNHINGTESGTNIITLGVGNHLYKLLAAVQYNSEIDVPEHHAKGFATKPFMAIIEALDHMKFPFIRITNNDSIKNISMYD